MSSLLVIRSGVRLGGRTKGNSTNMQSDGMNLHGRSGRGNEKEKFYASINNDLSKFILIEVISQWKSLAN